MSSICVECGRALLMNVDPRFFTYLLLAEMATKKLRYDCSLTEQLEQMNKSADTRTCGPKNILLVEASKEDRQLSGTNTALLERVWILSRPPQNLKDPLPTVSARRVQIVRSILDGDFQREADKRCPENPPCKEASSQGSTKASSVSVRGS